MGDTQKTRSNQELKEEIIKLKKKIKDLERERDILLALHRRDTDWNE